MATAERSASREDEIATLYTPHWFSDCDCTQIVRAVCIEYPIRAEVAVRACVDVYGRRPVGSALDAVSDHTGIRFVDHNEAGVLVSEYSTAIPGQILSDCTPVVTSGFSRTYYVKRDVIRACLPLKRKKCFICGRRSCRDPEHRAVGDASLLERMSIGDVYVLLHEPTKYVKVGFSSEPVKRIRAHSVSIPGKLNFLGVFPGGRALERAMHEDLADWLVPGHREWFFYSPPVQEYVSRLASVYGHHLETRGV